MVPAQPPNTPPRLHLMQNEPTDLFICLGAARFQTFKMSACIVKQIQQFSCYDWYTNGHWSKGYTKHVTPCFCIKQNLNFQPLNNRLFVLGLFFNILVTLTVVRVQITLKKQRRDKNKRTSLTQNEFIFLIFFVKMTKEHHLSKFLPFKPPFHPFRG